MCHFFSIVAPFVATFVAPFVAPFVATFVATFVAPFVATFVAKGFYSQYLVALRARVFPRSVPLFYGKRYAIKCFFLDLMLWPVPCVLLLVVTTEAVITDYLLINVANIDRNEAIETECGNTRARNATKYCE